MKGIALVPCSLLIDYDHIFLYIVLYLCVVFLTYSFVDIYLYSNSVQGKTTIDYIFKKLNKNKKSRTAPHMSFAS